MDAEQIAKNAVEAERQRVAALEALDSGDNPAVTAIIAEAKKNGKTADDVKTYVDAVKTVPVVQDAAQQLVADMIGDNKASGVEGIGTGAVDEAALEKAADAKAMDAMAQVMNKKIRRCKIMTYVEELQGVHYDELIGGTAVTPIIKNVTLSGVTKDTDLARGTLLALAPTTGKYSVLVNRLGTANDTMIAKAVLAKAVHQDGSGDL